MLQRNLLYTGVTRAKQMCILAGEPKALALAIKNNTPVNRNTNLEELLQKNPNNVENVEQKNIKTLKTTKKDEELSKNEEDELNSIMRPC